MQCQCPHVLIASAACQKFHVHQEKRHVSKSWQHFLRCCVMLTSAVPFHIVGRATKPPRRSSGTAVVPCGGTWLSTSPRLSPAASSDISFISHFAKTNWKPTSEWRVSWQAPVYHGWSFRIIFGPYSNPFHVHCVGSTWSIRKRSSLCSRNIWPVFKWIENIWPRSVLAIHAKSKFNLSVLSTMQRALGSTATQLAKTNHTPTAQGPRQTH